MTSTLLEAFRTPPLLSIFGTDLRMSLMYLYVPGRSSQHAHFNVMYPDRSSEYDVSLRSWRRRRTWPRTSGAAGGASSGAALSPSSAAAASPRAADGFCATGRCPATSVTTYVVTCKGKEEYGFLLGQLDPRLVVE